MQTTQPLSIPHTDRIIKRLVIHCTASQPDKPLPPQQLDSYHRHIGFASCGYHYYITTDGTIHPMRPLTRIGAHARGYNTTSIGIAYQGGLAPDGTAADTRTPAQKASLIRLLVALRSAFPKAQIVGHRDLSPDRDHNGTIEPSEWVKQCPCFNAAEEYAHL